MMVGVTALVALLMVVGEPARDLPSHLLPAEALTDVVDERAEHRVPVPHEASKKAAWLREKRNRPSVHAPALYQPPLARGRVASVPTGPPLVQAERLLKGLAPVPGQRTVPTATLFNQWTREALPLSPGRSFRRPFQLFLRDHFTGQPTEVDPQLLLILTAAAMHFHSARVDVVSGFRAPKYNLMLRKKGHQVARESQHMLGTAVDFRVRGAATDKLRDFVRTLRLGGVGYYAKTRFVHADTGKVRTWSGS
jgi:hypothetical protein